MPDAQQSPRDWYRQVCESGGLVADSAQLAAIEELQTLWQQLVDFKDRRNRFLGRSLLSPEVPRGLYIWGGVGRGKTFLMDGFYRCLPYRRKRRVHFHSFMSEVHHMMQTLTASGDPLMAVADRIAESNRLLCLDELHVDDIADAMLLGRLLGALFSRGVVLLITSNYPPDGLYPNGLQRQSFLPAIELIKRQLKVLHFEGDSDYRRQNLVRDPVFSVSDEGQLAAMFARLTEGQRIAVQRVGNVPARGVAREAVWFDFAELCGGNFDSVDYLEIAARYSLVFLSGVPKLTNAAWARRFCWLIDVLYDNGIKLVANFELEPDRLFEPETDESLRITSRLMQMQSSDYLRCPVRGQIKHVPDM